MKLPHLIIAAILAVAAVYFVSQRSGATGITQTGDDVSIAIGSHRLQATLASGEFTDSFLVIGGMRGGGELYFSALLSVIPLDTAQALAARYGDFRRCASPGATAGKNSVESMVLYAADGGVKRKLKSINKLALAGKDPIIKMTFSLLEITDHKIKQGGHEIPVQSHDIGPSLLVKEVQLIEEDLTL